MKNINRNKQLFFDFGRDYDANLDIKDIELIFSQLSESTDVLNFRVLRANEEFIELEYESYLGFEDAAKFLTSMGAIKNI